MVPIVAFDQIYSFDRDTLIKAIPNPRRLRPRSSPRRPRNYSIASCRLTDNAGATDEHRALNYLAVRYQAIYAKAAEEFALNASLTGVDVLPSPLSSTRKMVDVIFSYTNRNTDVTEKFFVRVDVTEEFPFLVTKLYHIMIGNAARLRKRRNRKNTMNIPEFTAQASLYRTSNSYRSLAFEGGRTKKSVVTPQLGGPVSKLIANCLSDCRKTP